MGGRRIRLLGSVEQVREVGSRLGPDTEVFWAVPAGYLRPPRYDGIGITAFPPATRNTQVVSAVRAQPGTALAAVKTPSAASAGFLASMMEFWGGRVDAR